MLRNYLKIAYRNLLKSKAFTAINLLGLSAAFVISFMLLLVLQEQLSYDQFHTKKERLLFFVFILEESSKRDVKFT